MTAGCAGQGGTYDYIIVGAGSAGCVLAGRLAADGRSRILLIEQGPRGGGWLVRMPKGFGEILRRREIISLHKIARPTGYPREYWVRGKTVGGSSAVNGMSWIRAQREDFEDMRAAGLTDWGWDAMAPYFDELDGGGHGGRVAVGEGPHTALAGAFINAAQQSGLPFNANLNGARQEGVGYLPTNIDRRGRRSDGARAFLGDVAGKPNLDIATGIRIDRVILDGRRAIGVIGRREGRPVEFRAHGEVLLSAGALESPLILQRSGIGPADMLAGLGVDPLIDSPDVGANLREHYMLNIQFRLKDWAHSENRSYSGARLLWHVARYLSGGGGIMGQAPYHAAAFARADAAPGRPELQLMFGPFSRTDKTPADFEKLPGMGIFGYVLRPESRGRIAITGADPDARPLIEPCYLATPGDRAGSAAAVRLIRAIAGQPALAALIEEETAPTASLASDEDIAEGFLRLGHAGQHACGVCAMGTDERAVLDGKLRVRGIDRLRVIDCSILPAMLSGNLNAPIMAMAMRAADLIRETRLAGGRA